MVLEGMGFGNRWRGWMTRCITLPMLSIMVNGSPTEEFSIERGLHQGDPFTLFLFNIAVELLNQLLKKALELNMIRGRAWIGARNTSLTSNSRMTQLSF
ncbi:hypothetical protein Ddye_024206 [Dipteronia dyeriana]|uniref:Reverse transcriptase domain-containing protein n=1 Tax=Dipteronia dyeriana TaxID=168575 RepID=A0AAD9TVE7_9ROSI|nr:hypothetical protein Ddye_024206 [Dipteronia dyeriana]